ncbi:hypothetical protein BH09VER1_BH09VER1_36500 [soil metagenome]
MKSALKWLLGSLLFCTVSLASPAADAPDPGSCFLKNGDRWLFVGDSITDTDTYRQLLLRVLQHYHPDADLQVGNSAVAGVTSNYQEKREFVPTVVTIMLGMNDVIHEDWSFTPDLTAKTENYRKSITEKVRTYKKLGAEVILMTPTYTDERFPGFFNVAMTRRFLVAFGQVIREVAAAEHCHWVPVGEELEAYQDTLGIDQRVRPDGVHPQGLGQYQIARSLWEHMNFAGRLDGSRKIVTKPPEPLPLGVKLASRFMNKPTDGLSLIISSPTAERVTASWSFGAARGTESLDLSPADTTWRVPLPEKLLAELPMASSQQLIVEFSASSHRRLCVIDLARTRVLHMKDGVVSGEIRSDVERPEGPLVMQWKIEDAGDELWLSSEVFDSEIYAAPTDWPFQRDGAQIWLDLRPPARFADPNPDRDIYNVMITVRDQPRFCVTPVSWIDWRLMYALATGGEKTATGYRWFCSVGGKISDARRLNLKDLAYFGLNITACDNDQKPPAFHAFPAQKVAVADMVRGLNALMIVDRKGVFPGDETTNLHLFY